MSYTSSPFLHNGSSLNWIERMVRIWSVTKKNIKKI